MRQDDAGHAFVAEQVQSIEKLFPILHGENITFAVTNLFNRRNFVFIANRLPDQFFKPIGGVDNDRFILV